MADVRIPKQILFGELTMRKRPQKKPKKRWKDCVREDMKQFGVDESTWYVDSLDRQLWRSLVSEGLMYFEENNTQNEESKRRNRKSKISSDQASLQPFATEVTVSKCSHHGCGRVFEGCIHASSLKRHITMMHSQVAWRDTTLKKCDRCQRFFSKSGFMRHACKRLN